MYFVYENHTILDYDLGMTSYYTRILYRVHLMYSTPDGLGRTVHKYDQIRYIERFCTVCALNGTKCSTYVLLMYCIWSHEVQIMYCIWSHLEQNSTETLYVPYLASVYSVFNTLQ